MLLIFLLTTEAPSSDNPLLLRASMWWEPLSKWHQRL